MKLPLPEEAAYAAYVMSKNDPEWWRAFLKEWHDAFNKPVLFKEIRKMR